MNWVFDPPGTSPTGLTEGGVKPDDYPALGWSDNHYIKGGDPYFDNWGHDLTRSDSESPSGVVVGWDDGGRANAAAQNGKSTMDGFFGLTVNPVSGTTTDERKIFYDYAHTWPQCYIDSISFSGTGPSINFTYGSGQWTAEGDELESEIN